MTNEHTVDDKWYQLLNEGETMPRLFRNFLGMLPSSPRCKICKSPCKGVGGFLMHLAGRDQSGYNPATANRAKDLKIRAAQRLS